MILFPNKRVHPKQRVFISYWDSLIQIDLHIEDIAYCRLKTYTTNQQCLEISELYVDEKYRNKHIATKILSYIFILAKLNHIRLTTLQVKENSWVKEWYKEKDFIEYGTYQEYTEMIKINTD